MSGLLQQCDRCRGARYLLAKVHGEWLCAACWKAAGSPFPAQTPPSHEQELTILERMQARGGADRYRANSGKA